MTKKEKKTMKIGTLTTTTDEAKKMDFFKGSGRSKIEISKHAP